ncbi:hypothetical protein V5799_023624, partial [Amblyomma americanum]
MCVLAVLVRCARGKVNHKLQHEVVDAFKAMQEFPVGIAAFDEDLDGGLDCLVTIRTEFDKESQKASYAWFLKEKDRHV